MSHKFVVWMLISGLALSLPCVSVAQSVNSPVATGELLIRGGSLTIEPEFQQIDPGRPTVVHTRLGDLSPGNAPAGLRVEAELSGPGLAQPLTLVTAPGDDLRIPGLHHEGSYSLSGIRLVQDGRVLQPATPDTATIEVRRLVVTSITSRPLTRDELLERGIVLDEDSYTAYHYSVGYSTESGIVDFPFDILTGPNGPTLMPPTDDLGALPNVGPHAIPQIPPPKVTSALFKPDATGGGQLPPPGDSSSELTIPGFIIIPNDLAFLNQFFSVILVVQNGALEGTPITLRDVVASLDLESAALRPAETSPPSIPGEPVGVVDPGPDGELGTGDDLTVIVAQASAHAEWLVEGREPGMHVFNARLEGWLEGLATGDPVPVACDIPGLVVVRDPRFSMTFFHPLTVRTGEDYDFRVVITNTGSSVVNDLTLRLPATSLSGAVLVTGEDESQIVESLAPGDHAMVTWRLSSRRTGRVTAAGFNTTTPGLDASFRFEVGIGELGIPLSPESIVLPPDVDDLPSGVRDHALGLLGLAYSLATAPEGASLTETSGDGSTTPLPSVSRSAVEVRATELAGLSRRHALGEPLYRTIAGLGLAWSGSNRWDPAFDALRRASRRGHGIELSMQDALATAIDDLGWNQVRVDLEELALTGRPAVLVYAEDAGYDGSARLRIDGVASGFSAIGQPADVGLFERELPGASMLEISADAWTGEIGAVAVEPNEDETWAEGAYRIVLEGTSDGTIDLEAVVVLPDGSSRRFHAEDPLPTQPGSIVTIDIDPETSTARAWIDLSGDGVSESWVDITVEERPAPQPRVIEARFDGVINSISGPGWSRVLLLLSQALDVEALPEVAVNDWTVTSDVTLLDTSGDAIRSHRILHGQLLVGQMDPSLVTLVVDGPLNPHGNLVLDSGSAPLPFVGGRFNDLDGKTIGTRGDLPTGMVRGLVIGSDGQPLPNAEVELYENMLVSFGVDNAVWMPSRSDRTTSDGDGLFLLDAVRVREDLIPAAENTFTLVVRDPVEGHRSLLKARLRRDGEVRFLQVAIAGRGDIVGTLTREDGANLTAPEVWARSLAYPQEGGVATPDENGNFRISDVPIGGYQLLGLDGDDYVYGSTSIPAAGLEAHVDLRILPMAPPLGRIDGSVLDEASGDPLAGLKVYLIPNGQQGATHLSETGPDGSFVMEHVPPGIVTLKAWNDSVGRWVAAESLEVVADATTSVTMLVREQETGSVRGYLYRVTSGAATPLAGAPVGIAEYGLASVTAADGSFQFPDVPLGQAAVIGWDIETGESASRSFQLLSDGQEAVVNLEIRPAEATLIVTVVDTTGYPVEGADVAIDYFGGPYQERTGPGGEVRFEDIGGGRTDILAKLGPSGHARLGLAGNVEVSPVGETSIVITLGDLIGLNVETRAHTTGGGTVDNVVQAIGYRKPGIKASGRIGLVPENGTFTCEVNDVGVCELSGLPTNAGSLAVEADNPFYGHAALYEYLEPEDEGKTLILDFSAPGVISGRVVDESDPAAPVEGARVELWITTLSSGVQFEQGLDTEADGTFLFELVPPGEFSIRVWHKPSDRLTWFKGYVSANQVISGLDLTVHGTGALEGEVAICFEPETLLRASSQVHIIATPQHFPHPFLAEGDPSPVQAKSLDAALDADQRATFAFAGLTSATWSIWAKAADHGSDFAEVSIPADGSSVTLDPELCLHPTGSISGTVASASDGDPVSSATVQLFQSRASILGPLLILTDATDEAGAFTFPDLPAQRSYFVMAYDPTTATGGQSPILRLCDTDDSGYGTSCSLQIDTTIGLTDRGSLQGHVLDGSGNLVAGALLRLRLSVVTDRDGAIATYRQELIAQTAVDGSFQFDGITGGTLSLEAFDPSSPLYVKELIEVDPGAPDITGFELQFPETGSATVELLTPDGSVWDGDPPRVAFLQRSPAFRELTQSVSSIEHLVVGTPATFDGIVFGNFDIGACAGDACSDATTGDVLRHVLPATLGAIDHVHMPDPPHDLQLQLTAVGRASVRAHVEQGGVAIPDAAVKIVGDGFYGHVDLSTATDSDGSTPALDGIGVGSYTVSASSSDGLGNAIGGATTLEIAQNDHGQTLDVMIDLEPSTQVSGVVLGANGLPTPAVVTATESQGSHRSFSVAVGEDGSFTLPAIPSDEIFTVSAAALSGPGRYTVSGIAIGSDPVDLGTLMLDEISPWLAAIRPANGASDVDPNVAIEIDFSERMRHESLTALQLKLRRGTAGVPVTVSLEDLPDPDGEGPNGPFTRATLDHAALASDTTYLVDVLHAVEDLGGRRPAVDVHSAFTTADVMPPELVEFSPIDDPDGIHPVGIDVVLRVTFSETLDEGSVTEATVRLLDQSLSDVPVQRLLDRDGFDLVANPLSALTPDERYTLEVDGVTDHAGNALATPIVLHFRTRDFDPPTVLLIPPAGVIVDGDSWQALELRQLVLTAQVVSNDAVAGVSFSINGVDVGAAQYDQALDRWSLPWTTPTAPAVVTLAAVAQDVSGNLSEPAAHTLEVLADDPPTGTLALGVPTSVLPNHIVSYTVDAADDHGLAKIIVKVTGAAQATDTFTIGGPAATHNGSFRLPATAPAGSTTTLSVEIVDGIGQTTPLPPVELTTLADTEPPVVTVVSPLPGSSVVAGHDQVFQFGLEDDVQVAALDLVIDGEPVTTSMTPPTLPGAAWTASVSATWNAPGVDAETTVDWSLTATDEAGNPRPVDGVLTIEPLFSPENPVVTIDCPSSTGSVAAGLTAEIWFTIDEDDEGDAIETYQVLVDGAVVAGPITPAPNTTHISTSFTWPVPSDAQVGDTFVVEVQAFDLAANMGASSTALEVIGGDIHTGGGNLDPAVMAGLDLVLADGTFTATGPLNPTSLTILSGATLVSTSQVPLDVTTQDLQIMCRGAIDVSALGYAGGHTHPSAQPATSSRAGGSHLGEGGTDSGDPGTTYGSVTRPQELGAGGNNLTYGRPGGGALHLMADVLEVDGVINAWGSGPLSSPGRPGAGGSIWIQTRLISGDGLVRAAGGWAGNDGPIGSGGGGAIAIEYDEVTGGILGDLLAPTSSLNQRGGAGTVFTKQTDQSFGDLVVDAIGIDGRRTVLPPLGSGQALESSEWPLLRTGLTEIPTYFVGHWVRITAHDGTVRGIWRIQSITGGDVTLDPNGDDVTPTIDPGDSWQGVYRFDSVTVAGHAHLHSQDPVLTPELTIGEGSQASGWDIETEVLTLGGGTTEATVWPPVSASSQIEVRGPVTLPSIVTPYLVIRDGGTISHPQGGSLTITSDHVVIEELGSIDVSARGYAGGQTHPSAQPATSSRAGGSHLGEGGTDSGDPGTTYGSVTRPQELGAGGNNLTYGRPGGGALHLKADVLEVDGVINAWGSGPLSSPGRPGAGGSIWIQTRLISGDGLVRAAGGWAGNDGPIGSGGGGAIAIEYDEVTGGILGDLLAPTSSLNQRGGAGTVFTKQTDQSFGDLVVDAIGIDGRRTVLPPLGSGQALESSEWPLLRTGLTEIPTYFVGHWVRITAHDGTVRGIWRIQSITGGDVTLDPNGDDVTPTIDPGDSWQGVYRFDSVTVAGHAHLHSQDPVLTPELTIGEGSQASGWDIETEVLTLGGGTTEATVWPPVKASSHVEVKGPATLPSIVTPSLVIRGGGTISHPQGGSLMITSDHVIIEGLGSIDVSARGYAGGQTHPSAQPASSSRAGGSHLGEGGTDSGDPGTTYGSVTRPQELGAGGNNLTYGRPGGGALHLIADVLEVDGVINARGSGPLSSPGRPGAGGSIWIQTRLISGDGLVRAAGGWAGNDGPIGSGGGGAIAIEYDEVTGGILGDLLAPTSDLNKRGGAGTVFTKQADQSFGDLLVDATGIDGRRTVLPSLGSGQALEGSEWPLLRTDLTEIPTYFVGHWVRITAPDGTVRGIWRIRAITSGDVTLDPNGDDVTPTIYPDDSWQGVYRFDSVKVRGSAHLVVGDLDDFGSVTVEPGSSLARANHGAPQVTSDAVHLGAHDWHFVVSGDPGAISDPDGISSALARNTRTSDTVSVAVAGDGSFAEVVIPGVVGDSIEIEATDAHESPQTSTVAVGALPANAAPPTITDTGFAIEVVGTGINYRIVGPAGSVADDEPPVRLHALNTATLEETSSISAAADGSFVLSLGTFGDNAGDPIQLVGTDSHPEPRSSTFPLGPMPDLHPPLIFDDKIEITTTGREYRVVGDSDAIREENDGTHVTVSDGAGASINAFYDEATGAFQSLPLPWPSGTPVTVIATDVGGNSSEVAVGQLPVNAGPPTIDPYDVDHSTADGSYIVEGGNCPPQLSVGSGSSRPKTAEVSSSRSPIDSLDGLAAVRLENRSTPGFGTWSASFSQGMFCPSSYFTFAPVIVDGAIGDEIVLVAEDDHPEWLAAESVVWTLPLIPGAPMISVTSTNLLYLGGAYHLSAPANAITSASGPLNVEARVWRPDGDDWLEIGTVGTTIASGDTVDLLLPTGSTQGDLVVVTATDVNGLTTHVRAGNLPAAVVVSASFQTSAASVLESTSFTDLVVELSFASAATVTVDYSLAAGTADYSTDWTAPFGMTGSLTFDPGVVSRTIEVRPVPDSDPEPNETVIATLTGATNAELGPITTSTLTIADDDTIASGNVYRSVRPGMGQLLGGSIGFSLTDGIASFDSPLPWNVVDRGDRLETSAGDLWIVECADDTTCQVVTSTGMLPGNANDATAVAAWPAFSSLSDAVDPHWHITGGDLVAADQTVTLLLYAGAPETHQVSIAGWTTSESNRLRIVVPTADGQRTGSQRHVGRWTDSSARLEIDGGSCVETFVGNLDLEGLQIFCGGDPAYDSIAVDVRAPDPVTVRECLIRLSPDPATAYYKTGIIVAGGTTTVQNTMIWDMPGDTYLGHAGILVNHGGSTLLADHVTVIGGMYGINNYVGTATVRNSIAAGATESCFDGAFTADSTHNLATDATAPDPPALATGTLTVKGAITGPDADLHLTCDVRDQNPIITHNFNQSFVPNDLFDGNSRTVVVATQANPAWVRLEFAQPRTVTGSSLLVSNCWSHRWSVEAADTVDDLENRTGSWQVLIPERLLENDERAFGTVMFDEPSTATVFQLNVERLCGGPDVIFNEWLLHGLNPACGTGVDLTGDPSRPVMVDVDSVARYGEADIGADQAHDLKVGFDYMPWDRMEAEGVARVPVVLSTVAAAPVSVRYETLDGSAMAGEDYLARSGVLHWAPNEVEQMIEVPLIADGVADDNEEFYVRLFDPDGAVMGHEYQTLRILDGTPPVRVQLSQPVFDAWEADGVLTGEVEIEQPVVDEVIVDVSAYSRTARISQDFTSFYGRATIPAGQTRGSFDITLVQDNEIEPTEELLLQLSWSTNAEHGPRAVAIGRIHDSSVPTVQFQTTSLEADEPGGPIAIVIESSDPFPSPGTVALSIIGGTAAPDTDYVALEPAIISFDTGSTSATAWLEPINNDLQDGPRTVIFELSSPSGALLGTPTVTTVTLADDESPAYVDPALFDLDLSGCLPHLTALPGAVTGPGTLDINVWVGSSYGDWYADTFQVASGGGFELDLGFLQPDSWILVNADHPLSIPGGGAYLNVDLTDLAPVVHEDMISSVWTGTGYEITIPPEAITSRLPEIRLELDNLDIDVPVSVHDPCLSGEPQTAVIAADNDQQNIQLEVCIDNDDFDNCTYTMVAGS